MIPPWLFPLVLVGSLFLLPWAVWIFRDVTEPERLAFDPEFSLAAIAALLASYHLFVHELTPLIVVAFLILGYEQAARPRGPLRKRSGALVLALSALVPIVGSILHFRNYSVLCVVLLRLMIWLTQELAALRKLRTPL